MGIDTALAADCGSLTMVNSVDIIPGPNRALIPVSINGTPELLLLDTGGYTSGISKQLVDQLNLPVRDITGLKVLDMYGNASTKIARVDELIIGHQKGHDINFAVEPDPNFGQRTRFVGIFGPNLMGKYDVELDFGAKKMNFFSPDHCAGHVVYWQPSALAVVAFAFRDMHIVLPVTLDGHQFTAEIDTGSTNTNITAEAVKRVFNIDGSTPGSIPLQSQAMPGAFERVFETLDFQGVAVKNPRLDILPDLIGSKDPNNEISTASRARRADTPDDFHQGARPELLIGMDVLKRLRVYIAFNERNIYISPATTVSSRAPMATPNPAQQSSQPQ